MSSFRERGGSIRETLVGDPHDGRELGEAEVVDLKDFELIGAQGRRSDIATRDGQPR